MEEAAHTFYWYDLETFGLDRRRDRPAQFAGCRTDADLNFLEGGSGETLYMRPSEDYLPSPESVLLTGIMPQECQERGLPEHDFAREVWSRFNAPGTISIGYNTLGFDNEVCRFLFWRNFQDPYAHQWMNGCGVWDLYPVIVAYWALRGDGIVWPDWKNVTVRHPEEERNGVCFRLEELAKANGILHDHAHDALSDVLATVGLARLLKEKAPKFWRWALENRTKAKVIEALGQGPVVCVKTIFGQQRGYTAIVQKLAVNPQSPNEVWVWDLSEDPSHLPDLTREDWQRLLFAKKDTLQEGEKRLPIYRINVSSCPFVCSNLKVLSDDRASKYGIDKDLCLRNFEILTEVIPKLGGAVTAQCERKEAQPADADVALYQKGFDCTRHDRDLKKRIASLSASELGEENAAFDDADFNELLFRSRGRNAPDTFDEVERRSWRKHCAETLRDGKGGARTISQYFDEIDRLQEEHLDDETACEKLELLYEWGERLGENFSS